MICHLVFYRMKPGVAPDGEARLIAEAGKKLPGLPGVKNLKVGRNIKPSAGEYPVALSMDFDDEAALDAYRVHPDHQAFVKSAVEPVVSDIRRFDFAYEK